MFHLIKFIIKSVRDQKVKFIDTEKTILIFENPSKIHHFRINYLSDVKMHRQKMLQ